MKVIKKDRIQPDPRIIPMLAKATIQDAIDIIVELVTNADDSYRRLGEVHGEIEIFVERRRNGAAIIEVKDQAEGMSFDKLENALRYGADLSEFMSGKSVRGLMGRGLKEACIADGEGCVTTVKNGRALEARLYKDRDAIFYEISDLGYLTGPLKKHRLELDPAKNGTIVTVFVRGERISVPPIKTLEKQIRYAYQLREILSSKSRVVKFMYRELTGKEGSKNLKYQPPSSTKILEETLTLPNYDDVVKLKVWESDFQLSEYTGLPPPFSAYGLIVRSEGIPVDFSLFGFENEPAMCYFFGFVDCDGIARKLREGEWGILTPNRSGLDWRNAYCKVLKNAVRKRLEPLIEEKKDELRKLTITPPMVSEKIAKLCRSLNRLTAELLEGEYKIPEKTLRQLKEPIIVPQRAIIPFGGKRTFSVYVPKRHLQTQGKVKATVKVDNPRIAEPNVEEFELLPHKKIHHIMYGLSLIHI